MAFKKWSSACSNSETIIDNLMRRFSFPRPIAMYLASRNIAEKDVEIFLKIWAVLALIATLKGMQQKLLGPDPWEQAWLNGGGNLTHMLFGQLRVFSFFTDAGQFGGAQGHAGVVFSILALNPKRSIRSRIFYAMVGALGIYGMMISGTRGSLAVPIFGFALYLILSKNVKIIVLGAIL